MNTIVPDQFFKLATKNFDYDLKFYFIWIQYQFIM